MQKHQKHGQQNHMESIFKKALDLHKSGNLTKAIELYESLIPSASGNPYLLFLLGSALSQTDRINDGIIYLKNSIQISPNPISYNNLGVIYSNLKKYDDAINCFTEAIKLDPQYAEGYSNLGASQREAGLPNESLENLNKAIQLAPNYRNAYVNMGNTLFDLGMYELSLENYIKANELAPDSVEILQKIGNALVKLERYVDALAYFNRAIDEEMADSELFSNLAGTLKKLDKLDEALANYDKSIALKPNNAEAYCNRGNTLKELGRFDEAFADYEKSIELKPDIPYLFGTKLYTQMHLCDWNNFDDQLDVLVKQIDNNLKASPPFALLALVDAPEIHKAASKTYVRDKLFQRSENPQFLQAETNSKIKVAYFSADFHNHATMQLMAEVFEKHDADKFEFFAFSFGPVTNDEWQQRAINSFSNFIDCYGLSDKMIAQLSRSKGIDIAVDLKGFTKDARTGIFAERAAPVQVNFLGYPGTMGAEYVDYIIADDVLVPEGSQSFYTEKIAYLPQCYQPNCRNRDISSKLITRSDFGLPEHGFVFSSFNNNYKITSQIFASWMRILKAVDGSVLWLLTSNPTAENNLRHETEKNGIDPDRLIFAQKVPIDEHLNRIRLADLMLDTFPYGAHTTCSDALRVGLPVITIQGKSFASRVAASLLTSIGLPDLICNTLSSYEDLAINLANSPKGFSEVRRRLNKNIVTSSLFDSSLFTKNLESLYRNMHQARMNNFSIDHIRVV